MKILFGSVRVPSSAASGATTNLRSVPGASNRASCTAGQASSGTPRGARGFTIVELLVATALTLMMLAAVVAMFARIGNSVTEARSTLEMSDRLRASALRLQMDLAGVTVTMLPPRRPEANEGYFEYIEGPVSDGPNATIRPWDMAVNGDTGQVDTTVGDFDDILMFTTRSSGRPFVGRRANAPPVESDVAEVAWFVRGRTLFRRVLLVAPSVDLAHVSATGFYAAYDVSARWDAARLVASLVANTLGDLTRRECRFAHPTDIFPFDARRWGQLGLPTLRECSSPGWDLSNPIVPTSGDHIDVLAQLTNPNHFDFWSNDPKGHLPDFLWINLWKNRNNFRWKPSAKPLEVPAASDDGSRIAEDVILTHVIGFDVKAFDPGAFNGVGGYVDLGYDNHTYAQSLAHPLVPGVQRELFCHTGNPGPGPGPGLAATGTFNNGARVYDTSSFHYETLAGQGVNGFDDPLNPNDPNDHGDGSVDNPSELVAPPPYPVPLRGVQVKIRVFEPDSRQVREVTVVQDFLPK